MDERIGLLLAGLSRDIALIRLQPACDLALSAVAARNQNGIQAHLIWEVIGVWINCLRLKTASFLEFIPMHQEHLFHSVLHRKPMILNHGSPHYRKTKGL